MVSGGLEVGRKLIHFFTGFVLVLLLFYNIIDFKILGLVVIIAVLLSFICLFYKIPFFYWFLTRLDRSNDLKYFPGKGAVFYILGAFLVVLFFDKNIASASILILAVGDSFGYVCGKYFGFTINPLNKNKYLEGSIIAVVVSFCSAFIFVSFVPALCGSIAAMFIESLDLKFLKFKLDDNILIPVVSGFVIYLISFI